LLLLQILLQNKYNIGVLTVNMEFMWLGTKRMERLAKAHLSPISKPRHINSIFKNECYSTVNQSISKKHPIVAFILWAKQRINRF
jgi:hypothetical protein